jgi:F-type H+-transporting ATPase subunit delta
MLDQEVARKYAHALFLSTKEKNLIDEAYRQFGDLKVFLAQDSSLLNFLNAPHILEEDKKSVVRDVFSGRLEPLFIEFLLVLIEKNRIAYLPQVIDVFNHLVEEEKGIERVKVVTATQLDDSQKKRLAEKLAQKTGLQIILEERVDPSILGGMIVMMNNEIVDGSVRHGLQLLSEQLGRVRVH